MENPLSLGQPIPTGIITATEILSPGNSVAIVENSFDDTVAMGNQTQPLFSAAQVLTGMMFMPLLAWRSVTASYLRFLGVIDPDTGRA